MVSREILAKAAESFGVELIKNDLPFDGCDIQLWM